MSTNESAEKTAKSVNVLIYFKKRYIGQFRWQ